MECQFCGKECKNKNSLVQHEIRCKSNPNCINARSHSEKWLEAMHNKRGHSFNQYTKAKELGLPKPELSEEIKKKLSERFSGDGSNAKREDVRKKISDSMKIAHAEGRAHNIGSSRWNNEHSYPEKWFIKMLKYELNMIEHVDYETEYPFYKYSLDFAWSKYKLCIEVDGEQHQRFEEYIKRDAKKDALLARDDWKILRIRWDACINNTRDCIQLVKKFLNQHEIAESYLEFKLKEQLAVDKTSYLTELKSKRWDIIKSSNIDFSKFGWVKQISELFGISENKAGSYIRKNFPEFYKECCFKRKQIDTFVN